jgi:apolipoprotein N-acyltransferase
MKPPGVSWLSSGRNTALIIVAAVVCFHLAYGAGEGSAAQLFIIGYVIALAHLARLGSARSAFYAGLVTGFLCYAPQLTFFWTVFSYPAIALWLVLAFWIALFAALAQATLARWGITITAIVLPFLWTGLEYFRSELYYLKFSWLNVAYAMPAWIGNSLPWAGMYGVGFLAATIAAISLAVRPAWKAVVWALVPLALLKLAIPIPQIPSTPNELRLAGVQLEFPSEHEILASLDQLVSSHPDAQLLVLSEYTLGGPVPGSLAAWCRQNHRYLLLGGKDPVAGGNFFDTAFVVGPTGEIVFQQAKSVPIPFFNDGLRATHQSVWKSPWGKIGICICFDLSFTRATDELIRQGAQILVVPSMDEMGWGAQQHRSDARVAPIRAAEYGVPIFRLASSGISQAVNPRGHVIASAPFPGQGETLFAALHLPAKGTLPLDRWLAPTSVGFVALIWAWLIVGRWLGRSHSQSRTAKK